jgi:hypothetical protein
MASFFAAQHVLKQSLETRRSWSEVAGLDVAAAGEDLKELANRLPEDEWRIYTAACTDCRAASGVTTLSRLNSSRLAIAWFCNRSI